MKKTGIALSLLFVTLPLSASAAEVPASSRITEVTVYQDRALVTREAEVSLEAGSNSILFDGLPAFLIEDSLRADGSGGAAVTIGGVEIKRLFSAEEANPRVAAILETLEKLQYDLREIQSRNSALQEQRQFLDNVKNFSSAQVSKDLITKGSPASEWTGLSQFMLDSYTDVGKKALELEKAVQDKNKEISAKQQELYALQSGQQTEKKTALVNVDAKSKTSFKVILSYVVPQATWNISYDAKVTPEKNNCALISYGNVRQWTGEDWNDVQLTLSSAKPAIGGRMPELSPWYLDFFQVYPSSAPERRAKNMLARADAPAAYEAMDAVAGAAGLLQKDIAAELAQADISQEMGSVHYDIVKPMTILSDNRSYKTPVQTENFKTELDYEATPKLSPYAYIHSKVVNDKDHPLVAGALNVFVNDNYVGQSSIGTVGRNESFDLYLGIDEEVKVKRTALTDKQKKSMLGLKVRKDYAFKFEMENYKSKNIKLSIYDQLPVSRNGDIKSELISTSVKPAETKDLGLLKWSFDLSPKEKKELELQFYVEYPADKNISGI